MKTSGEGRYGWASRFAEFQETPAPVIRGSLQQFLRDASEQQIRAWDESISPLQHEVREVIDANSDASAYSAILEYELPMESRRTDVVILSSGSVLVLELKSKRTPSLADIDQAAGYARDLRAYHRECHGRLVHPILVLTRGRGRIDDVAGVRVVGLDAVDELVEELEERDLDHPIIPSDFLAPEAYTPLPTIVEAARELFESGTLRRVRRAAAITEPALEEITRIIHDTARSKTRRLVLLTGVPGAGKTLVGLQVAHARFLDDLAVPRANGDVVAPAVYLSGNGPLVDVLQYELKSAGGGGRTFVRGVKDYVARYTRKPTLVPNEHVLIYDEAQRAWDAEQVDAKHEGDDQGLSEPEHFVEFAERVPDWCVILGLIGTGQEIHVGEEGGLIQWRWAVDRAADQGWIVHGPPAVSPAFGDYLRFESSPALHLDKEIRFHLAQRMEGFVAGLLGEVPTPDLAGRASQLEQDGYHLRITRDLDKAKIYFRDRYGDDPEARYGILASSRDKDLRRIGIRNNTGPFTGFRYGPWYVEGDDDDRGRSCRSFTECVTEFGSQGLELDAALLAWGTDFVRDQGTWSNEHAIPYRNRWRIKDARALRVNAYRVLLTRARDATVVFVPELPILDETYQYLRRAGFRELGDVEAPTPQETTQ